MDRDAIPNSITACMCGLERRHLANDPAFYINHCNVDRIWEAWIVNHGRNYLSSGTESGAPVGHTA